VILNLLSNALKFTDENGQIKITCEPIERVDGMNTQTFIKVSVKDDGIGISKEDNKKLFKQFGCLESS
jgi:signal transduction histidine kinase